MPEEKKQDDHGRRFADNVAKAASTGKHAVKAAAKAGAGDVAGAVAEILRDENMRRAILAAILLFSFLLLGILLMCGAAITGTIEAISTGFAKNWDENWEAQGVASNGNALYLYSSETADKVLMQTIVDTIESFFITDSAVSNSTLEDGANLTRVDNEDYETTLQAVKDMEALTGTDGALQKRLNMIKGRVEQRGIQIVELANEQYALEAIGIVIAEHLMTELNNETLYYGIDFENSKFNVDDTAFQLSDLQAVKILAAYSIQHDCVLSDSDMWDLMDYCGWYSDTLTPLYTEDLRENSLYDSHASASYSAEIGGVVQAGDDVDSKIYALSPPSVPYWTGSFAPQWYYEEIAQLKANNERYDYLNSRGDTEALESMIRYETDSDGNIILDNFSSLHSYQTYGIIDKLYMSSTASLTVARTEYVDALTVMNEALQNLSFSNFFTSLWGNLLTEETKYTALGNKIYRDPDNKHSYTIYDCEGGTYYLLGADGSVTSQETESGGTLAFGNLAPDTSYDIQRHYWDVQTTMEPGANGILRPVVTTTKKIEPIESFRTLKGTTDRKAFKLILKLDVGYSACSIDTLATELMGLWPGDLSETEIGTDGLEYAAGHTGNENLLKTWTDVYTDENGKKHTITFERQQGHQLQAYQDYIIGVAEQLGYDTTGLYEPDYGYGDTIVSMALKEYEYYKSNNLRGGMRYWNIAKEAIGWNFGYDAGYCGCFVMCCAYLCGFIGPGQPFGDLGTEWAFWPGGIYEDLIEKGGATAYHGYGSDYKPVPGDIMFTNYNLSDTNFSHICIVKQVYEDGTMETIDGNIYTSYGGKHTVGVPSYSSYKIGTSLYTDIAGTCMIAAYVHPNYPPAYNDDPAYLHIPSANSAILGARQIGSGDQSSYIFGLPRFREDQIQEVTDYLRSNYPDLYTDKMQTALDNGDMRVYSSEWNQFVSSRYSDAFRAAQLSISAKLYVQPVAEAVEQQTGFRWTLTPVRENILLGLVTTSASEQSLINVLATVSSGLNNEMTDAELLSAIKDTNKLYNITYAHRSDLWPSDSPETQREWATGIYKLLEYLASELEPPEQAPDTTDN